MQARTLNGTGLLLLGLGVAIGALAGSVSRSDAQSATPPRADSDRPWRYTIGVSDHCSILLDTQTGESWRLMVTSALDPRKQEWVKIPRQEDESPRPVGIKR